MEDDHEQRRRGREAGLNQLLRRDLNEVPLERPHGDVVEFVCECCDPACDQLLALTTGECEFVRRVPNRLVVKPGHVDDETERVLMEEPGRFQVIEKFGSGGEVVAHLDLRRLNRRRADRRETQVGRR